MVDIGGGSAEIISSEDGTLMDAVSKPLGALRLAGNVSARRSSRAPRELHQMAEFVDEKLEAAIARMGLSGTA